MSRWKINVQQSSCLARVHISDGDKPIGLITMPLRQYHEAAKELVTSLTLLAQGVIAETLEKRLWADAQAMTLGLDASAAIDKMEAFGWTKEKVQQYAAELALTLGQRIVEKLP